MSVNFKQIGQRVKEIRCVKGLSQAELAEQIDMSVSYISLIETAAKKASLSTLVLIANALGVTVDALLNGNQTNDMAEYYCDLVCLINDCNNYEKPDNQEDQAFPDQSFEACSRFQSTGSRLVGTLEYASYQ